ncbi:MAG: hypothetical protein JKY67_01725 [Pseudomonadales bacterium]|nr:hypothetical protein [Pseudomonadales bacterium]PCI21254.1 MAG: hypothetical protein COB64_00020 [Candidatus Wolfebacteria bacterium]
MSYNFKNILKISALVILFASIIGFSYFKTKDLFFGVTLEVEGIVNGESRSEQLLEFNGTAQRAVKIHVNGREIFIDTEGTFNDSLILLPGYNIITIEAIDKFGKKTKNIYEIVLTTQ